MQKLLKAPIHPFLFALYPAFFFYAQNLNEVFVRQALPSLLISLSILTITWLFFLIIYRRLGLASFMTTIFLLLFFSYGHVKNKVGPLNYVFRSITIGEDKILITIWGLILLLTTLLAFRYQTIIKKLTPALNLFVATSLFLTLVQIVGGLQAGDVILTYENKSSENTKNTQAQITKPLNLKNLPDIYYIILDKYAGNPTLLSYYGYDNSDFTDYLKQKGFYVALNSKANYPRTSYSLASSLNMEYLDTLAEELNVDVIAENTELKVVFPKLRDHKVWQLLKPLGYHYYHLGSWFEPTRYNLLATENFVFNPTKIQLDEFTMRFLGTTLIEPFAHKYLPLDFDTQHQLNILYAFDKLMTLVSKPAPKFVFAHILVPHGPSLLDENCQNPPSEWGEKSNIEKYLEQMRCGNKRTKETIEQILNNPKASAIIIVQSDEGPNTHVFPMPNGDYAFAGVDTGAIIERTRIQDAIYFPDKNYKKLYQTISPVNTFRLIFSQYFGFDFPLCKDKIYISQTEEDLYNFAFTEVDKRIYEE